MRKAMVTVTVAVAALLLLQFVNASYATQAPRALGTVPGIIAVGNSNPNSNSTTSRVFAIIVGSSGFNGSSAPLSIQVSQGDNVTLKFIYGDDSLSFDNPHKVRIEGYNIETEKIDKQTPVQEVTFAAGQVGTFQFHCVIPCFGMENLQQGSIVVAQSTQGPSVETNLSSIKVEQRGSLVSVSTRLVDKDGAAVTGAIVSFMISTDFGPVKLGQNSTTSDGTVQLLFSPGSTREMVITASFAGSGRYSACKAAAVYSPPITQPSNVEVSVNPELIYPPSMSGLSTPYVSGQMPMVDLRLVGIQPIHSVIIVTVALLVVISVWSVYALVLKEMLAVRKAAKTQAEEF